MRAAVKRWFSRWFLRCFHVVACCKPAWTLESAVWAVVVAGALVRQCHGDARTDCGEECRHASSRPGRGPGRELLKKMYGGGMVKCEE